jgi:hypothetical protein
MYGQKLFEPSNRYGHKLANSSNRYGHKWSNPKRNSFRTDEQESERKSDLERHSTREHHDYHNAHNPMHR